MIATRLVPAFLCIGLSAALVLRNPDHNENDDSTVCGGELLARKGMIRSPGYPNGYRNGYPNNMHCEWIIQPRPNSTTWFKFHTMDVEGGTDCSSEYIEIREVGGDEDVVLGRYCNSNILNRSLGSKATVKITLHVDASTPFHGFELHYSISEDGPQCGGIFWLSPNVISSPNITDVNETRECEWIVLANGYKPIRFEIEILSTNENPDCEHDYYPFKIQIWNRPENETDIPTHISACNREKPWVWTSHAHSTKITFQADSVHTLADFRMSYSTVEE